MVRFIIGIAIALTASPALSQAYYAATLADPTERATIVTRDTVWRCASGVCTARKGASRDTIMCELLVRETGPIEAFSVAGTAFDDAALARCNARSRR